MSWALVNVRLKNLGIMRRASGETLDRFSYKDDLELLMQSDFPNPYGIPAINCHFVVGQLLRVARFPIYNDPAFWSSAHSYALYTGQ